MSGAVAPRSSGSYISVLLKNGIRSRLFDMSNMDPLSLAHFLDVELKTQLKEHAPSGGQGACGCASNLLVGPPRSTCSCWKWHAVDLLKNNASLL